MLHRSGPQRRRALAGGATLGAALLVAPALAAQSPATGYHDHAALGRALDSLQRAHPRLVQVTTLARSPGGRAVQAVRLGAGADADARPALLVVANAHGPHVVGSEIALAAVQRLAARHGRDSAITRLLDEATIYVIPRANPDAAEAFFQRPLAERLVNGAREDDDKDGAADEDGPDDLNGDGVITMMRVADPAGEWMADAAEPFLMRRATATRGERGGWSVYVEGVDDDRDGEWNEDAAGGTNVNRNYSYDYPWFTPGAGVHQLSADEARAVTDFVVAHPNIAAAYVLGPQDNLIRPWEFRRTTGIGGNAPGTSQGGPLQSILQPDEAWFAETSRRYRRTTGQTRGPASAPLQGDLLSHLYYDMGRLAFGSYGWVMPEAPAAPADTARDSTRRAARPAGGGAASGGSDAGPDALADERAALRWLRANAPDAVIEWRRVSHPDFPGRVVEVGGFSPYARTNPPAALLDSTLAKQTAFVAELAGMLPRVSLREVRVEQVSDRLFRVTAQVANDGFLPTQSAIGARVRWQRPVRVELKTGGDQQVAGGRAVQLIAPVAGSGRSTELTWLVVAAPGSSVTLEAASPSAGRAAQTVTLRAR
jgi:hypothetical protein